jgi:hypothetical protein
MQVTKQIKSIVYQATAENPISMIALVLMVKENHGLGKRFVYNTVEELATIDENIIFDGNMIYVKAEVILPETKETEEEVDNEPSGTK